MSVVASVKPENVATDTQSIFGVISSEPAAGSGAKVCVVCGSKSPSTPSLPPPRLRYWIAIREQFAALIIRPDPVLSQVTAACPVFP